MLRRRLGWWSARLLARWLPDLSAESIDEVGRSGVRWANRFPARWRGTAGPLESVTEALWDKGRYAEAVSYAGHVVQIRRKQGDRIGEATALSYLGLAHWHAGELDEALRQFELALPLVQADWEPADEATVRRHIGRVHADRGEPDIALGWLESALAIYREVGDPREQDTREDIRDVRSQEGR